MEKLITAFTANILEALEIASGATINQPKNEVHNVLICGMGGSGIGGKIVSEWVQDDSKVPVLLLNDYTLPHYVDKHTLVIGSSYSGNTEETLIALKKAKNQGAHIIGICSGGEVKEFCIEFYCCSWWKSTKNCCCFFNRSTTEYLHSLRND